MNLPIGFRSKLLHIEFAESIIGIEEPAIYFYMKVMAGASWV
jgi:hypothetical protein